MINTGIHLEGEARNWLVKGHDKYGNEVTPIDIPQSLIGAGGFRSDVRDMLQFLAVNIEEPDTELKKILHTMYKPQGEVIPGQMSIGIGWLIRHVGASRIVWHNGYTGYFHSFIGFDPDRKTGVVILANSDHDPDDIGFHLLNTDLSGIEHIVFSQSRGCTGYLYPGRWGKCNGSDSLSGRIGIIRVKDQIRAYFFSILI
jgi:serine-type D-Ala-D-Ala carboxypeptidase/endopeptidase